MVIGMARRKVVVDWELAEFSDKLIRFHLPKVVWSPEAVVDAIVDCRLVDRGLPMFRTRYVEDFEYKGKPAVMFICWAGKETPAGRSVMFVDVPRDVYEEMKKRAGDWRWLIKKYKPELLEILDWR